MAVFVRSFCERGTRVEMVFQAAESAVSAALHAVRLVSSSRPMRPGSARPAAGPTAGAFGQVSLRVALASGWVDAPASGSRSLVLRTRNSRREGVPRCRERGLGSAPRSRAPFFERANAPGSARPAAGPTAGCLRLRLAPRRLSLRLGRIHPQSRSAPENGGSMPAADPGRDRSGNQVAGHVPQPRCRSQARIEMSGLLMAVR